jgi:hypothetical protein
MNGTSNTESSLARSVSSELAFLLKQISDSLKQSNDIKKYLVQVQKAFDKSDIVALEALLQKKTRDNLAASYPVARDTLEKLSLYVRRESQEIFASLSGRFQAYCDSQGISLRGKFPKLTVDNLLDIELYEQKHSAKIGTIFLRTLDWEKIRTTMDLERDRIWAREFNPGRFRDQLSNIYTELLKAKPNPVGWVRLEDVYQALKARTQKNNPNWKAGGRLVAYYRDEYSADLSKLWQAQASRRLGSPEIELSGIRDPRLSYKVILPDGQIGSYGHMRPKKEED